MTVFRQSHSQQMRTWGHATATLRRNCACGAGKGRMRAGRVTYPRQEKPTCAQVALISESLQVNRDNEPKLCAKRKLKQGVYLCLRVNVRHISRQMFVVCKCMILNKTAQRPKASIVAVLTFTDASPTREALHLTRTSRLHKHNYTNTIQLRTLRLKGKETSNQQQTNSLTTAGTLSIFPRAGVKARGILLGIAVYDWLTLYKNNNKNSVLKASYS